MNLLVVMSIFLCSLNCFGESNDYLKQKLDHYLLLLDRSESFEDITSFILQNPNWPVNRLRSKAERLSFNTSSDIVCQWFSKHPPITGVGYKNFATLCSLEGIVQQAWIRGSFNAEEEKDYLKKHGKILTQEDHIKKITSLLWKKDVEGADRLIHLLEKDQGEIFKAAISLFKKDTRAIDLFKKIKVRPQILNYAYLHYNKDKTPGATEYKILTSNAKNHNNPKEWSGMNLYYAREFFEHKKYKQAYEVANNHNSTCSSDAREAEWFAGWISLRFLRKPNLALKHFEKMHSIVKVPISLAKASYWIARSYKDMKDYSRAKIWFEKSAKYGYPFYSLLAQEELKYKKINFVNYDQDSLGKNSELAEAIKILIQDKNKEVALHFTKHAIKNAKSKDEIIGVLHVIKKENDHNLLLVSAKEAAANGVIMLQYLFPVPSYQITNKSLSKPIIYAIIRHESEFDQHVIASDAGMGLMQLMPNTAKLVAKSIGERYDANRLITDASYNIRFGSQHLEDHLKYYRSYVLSVVAYNAGRKVLTKWLEKFRDLRKMRNTHQIIDWIESVPYPRTREYIMRFMENFTMYKILINKDSKLTIAKDLRYAK